MPQIEIPFTPGQRVRAHYGYEFEVHSVQWFGDGEAIIMDYHGRQFAAPVLTLVEPVIEWERDEAAKCWWGTLTGDDSRYPLWAAFDDGGLKLRSRIIGFFPDPRSVAEDTQKMWNARKK